MDNFCLSYREAVPDTTGQDDWTEITLNSGGTQSTLQDIKVAEKSGGYCYLNAEYNHTRNRYIYWRTYQDVLELSEISLDFNLYKNNLRYKFTDSPVISVSIIELDRYISILVTTVCSLHRLRFRHPDLLADTGSSSDSCSAASGSALAGGLGGGSSSSRSSALNTVIDYGDAQSYSIFREARPDDGSDPNSCHVIEALPYGGMPHAAASYLSPDGELAYFAVAYPSQLMLYVMNFFEGHTVVHHLKEHTIVPRLLKDLKDALTGKSDINDADYATSLAFTFLGGQIYLLALYRNDQLVLWSASSLQPVCSINCVRDGVSERLLGPQSNSLRKISDTSVCAFLSHSTGSEFVCLDIQQNVGNSSGLGFVRRKVIAAPQLDLTDFDVSESRIWALWSNAEGEFSVSNYPLVRGIGMNWVTAALEPPPDRYCVGIEQGMDPREAYCSYIFHPGKFDASVIAKALCMFRRANERFDHCSMPRLKELVCQFVEEEIQRELRDYDISDDEYLETATRLWERFYTCCEQYHTKANQPTGLFILEPINGVCVVKKNTFSLLRPCETLEHLMLAGEDVDIDVLVPIQFPGKEFLGRDMINLVAIISQIEKWLPEDVKMELERKLYQLEMPSVLIAKLAEDILGGETDKEIFPRNFLVHIRQRLQSISNIRSSIAHLLDTLRMDCGNPGAMHTHGNLAQSTRFYMSIGSLFGSQVGLSLLSDTVREIAMIRFAICRNLLILQQLLIDSFSLSAEISESIRSQFMPDTVIFLQSYFVMVWISETPIIISQASALETSIQRLSILQMTNGSGRIYSNGKCYASPLLRVFLNAKGLYTSLSLFAENLRTSDSPLWQCTLIPLATVVSQLIWPVSFNFVFGEWLFGTCQHIIIEDYVRLLNSWCEWNVCSRQFILAVSLLDSGEPDKAYDLFLQSAKGVLKEEFLNEKILKDTSLCERLEALTAEEREGNILPFTNQAVAHYYLKIIQLFEQHNALCHIISLAQVAIGLLDKHDPQLPMFQSIVFNNHLLLEHYEEAYHALIYNVDASRRKDCLRQLVITLFNSQREDLLMKFPYVGLQEEFENIVESRARSLTMEENDIYDFLYAFHVNNGNMRKASAVMYEQAMRFQLEGYTSIEFMQKRSAALLISLNALHLIDPRYRWIAKPVIGAELYPSSNQSRAGSSSDIEMDGESDDFNLKRQVVVLEIKDIRKELMHTNALIQLAQFRRDLHSFINAGPQEVSVLLSSCGLYTAALKLAKCFDISLVHTFESLTTACVHTASESPSATWAWLQENDLADLPHRPQATDMAWSLLEKLVNENEEVNSTRIRKAVVNKLLTLNAFVPQWLYNGYKLQNCPELLYLYVRHNRLLEAAALAQEMLRAMLGAGSEYFSCKYSVAITSPEMCLPVNTLDLLLHGLRENARDDMEYKVAVIELEDTVNRYMETALRTGKDKIEMAYKALREQQRMEI